MKKEIALVQEFHNTFQVVSHNHPTLISREEALKRYTFMREEVEEYLEGVRNGDVSNVTQELCDILYTTYGTIITHGLQDIIEDVFAEVHRSNMTKEFHPYKIKKGQAFQAVDLSKFF